MSLNAKSFSPMSLFSRLPFASPSGVDGVTASSVDLTAPSVCLVEQLEPRQLLSGMMHGVTVSMHNDPGKAIPALKDVGAEGIRYWLGTDFKTKNISQGHVRRLDQYAKAGMNVTLLVTFREDAKSLPSPGETKEWFSWLLREHPSLKKSVGRWEIVNEINLGKYFPAYNSPQKYVDHMLKPAYEVLKPQGQTVVGGSVIHTASKKYLQEMVDAGYLKYCDIANIHPYGYSGDLRDMKRFTDEVKQVFGNKPLTATEWGFQRNPGFQEDHRKVEDWEKRWADALDEAYDYAKKNFESIFYYRLTYSNTSRASAQGLFRDDLNSSKFVPRAPFYDVFKSWTKGSTYKPGPVASNPSPAPSNPSPAPVVKPAPTPAPKPTPVPEPKPSGGVKPIGAVKGAVMGPSKDTYVQKGQKTLRGKDRSLMVKKSHSGRFDREALLEFDIAKAGRDVTSAKLRLFGRLNSAGSITVRVAEAGTNWSESNTIWGRSHAGPVASTAGTFRVSSTKAGWHEVDLTSLVKRAKAAGKSKVNLILRADTRPTEPYAAFNSREATSNRPELRLAWK